MRHFIKRIGYAAYEFLLFASKYKFFVVLVILLLILAGIYLVTTIMEDYRSVDPLM